MDWGLGLLGNCLIVKSFNEMSGLSGCLGKKH